MKSEDILLYAPSNAKALTQEQLNAMQSFTLADLQELAKAYPNHAQQAAYLVIYDSKKKPKEQLYSLTTWKNLAELHRMGMTNFYALTYKSLFNNKEVKNLQVAPMQDLTSKEAKKAPGLTTAGEQNLTANNTDAGNGTDKPTLPLDKMDKAELAVEYKKAIGEEAPARMSKPNMIKAIKGASKK